MNIQIQKNAKQTPIDIQHTHTSLNLIGRRQTSTMVIFLERWDGNVFFPRHHCHRWFFNGFTIPGPSPLNVFFSDQPLTSMVFRWFSQIQVRWSAMVLTLKKTYKCAYFYLRFSPFLSSPQSYHIKKFPGVINR